LAAIVAARDLKMLAGEVTCHSISSFEACESISFSLQLRVSTNFRALLVVLTSLELLLLFTA
jgi:hypothetical protein